MNFDLTQSIVRILKPDRTTAGTGFFVAKNGLIATCAHVIASYKPGEEVSVVLFSGNEKHQAIIEKKWWRKPSDEDVAILRLLNTPSHDISMIPLGYPWNIENIPLLTFGFPASKPVEGLNGKCEVIGRTTENDCPVLQVRSPEVTRGFSGAPVLNPVTNRIVGMITAISKPDKYGRQAETTFITPSNILANICPEVEEVNIERIIIDLKSKQLLGDLFVDLEGQSSTIKDIKKEQIKESFIADQLGLDPIFSLMETSVEEDSRVGKRFTSSNIDNTENFSDGVVGELNKYKCCVLLGEAGSGKSTTLERIVLDVAERHLAKKKGVIPVHLKLSAWQAKQSFINFICSQWSFVSDPLTSLENGYAALYLDGLNEIGSDTDTRVQQLREWLTSKPESKKIIVTCRTDDYLLGEFDLNIPIVKIESMEESRIRLFSKKYLDRIGKSSELFLSRLFSSDENRKSSSLVKLASNPFMLTALIISYASSDALPRNKGLLTKKLVESLWGRERTRNWSGWLPYDEIELMFSKLAFHMIDSDNVVEIPVVDALKYCNHEILQIARSGNILRIENDKLKFYHQLIQEFFAAIELKKVGLSEKLQRPHIRNGQRIDSRWDQVIIALCGISEFPDGIVNYILKIKDPYLAAVCISSGIVVSESTIEKTVEQLIGNIAVWDWVDNMCERRSEVVYRAITDIGKPAVPFLASFFESEEVVLLDHGSLAKETILLAGGAALGVLGTATLIAMAPQTGFTSLLAVVPLAKKLSENEHFNTLVQSLKQNPVLAMKLKEVLEEAPNRIDEITNKDPIRKIRLVKLIVSALGEIGGSKAHNLLEKLSKNDSSEEVRKAARLEIKKIGVAELRQEGGGST
ncbi:MAG: trypsin-like peptidase domain-containing protein [Microcoleaceae cyanobacterium]